MWTSIPTIDLAAVADSLALIRDHTQTCEDARQAGDREHYLAGRRALLAEQARLWDLTHPAPVVAGNGNGDDCATRARVLAFIGAYIDEHTYAPTIREIVDGCGLASTSVVKYHLDRLQRDGRITREPTLSRTIRILPG